MTDGVLPLSGVRVLELGHVVMGACCGVVLADMGAEVIKVEKSPDGDDTRRFEGFGKGLFHFFNRNKRSLVIDLKSEAGKSVLRKAIAKVDVLIENFGPGAVERLGFGYAECAALNPRLIYCSLKGFMPGPYEHRPSLDNLVQMMGGLAYMTGPPGRPMRAGASVTDIMGATYGALGIVAALRQRDQTGQGQQVTAALFEATAFLVGQHMSTAAISREPMVTMSEGASPWTIYDLFETADGDKVCIGIISDKHWRSFCEQMSLTDLACDERLNEEAGRQAHRDYVLDALRQAIRVMPKDQVIAACDTARIPFAPVTRPDELADDPHLLGSDGMVATELEDGRTVHLPKLPLQMAGDSFGLRHEPPAPGEGAREFLHSLGFNDDELDALTKDGVVVAD